jgi:hypothetical protein
VDGRGPALLGQALAEGGQLVIHGGGELGDGHLAVAPGPAADPSLELGPHPAHGEDLGVEVHALKGAGRSSVISRRHPVMRVKKRSARSGVKAISPVRATILAVFAQRDRSVMMTSDRVFVVASICRASRKKRSPVSGGHLVHHPFPQLQRRVRASDVGQEGAQAVVGRWGGPGR